MADKPAEFRDLRIIHNASAAQRLLRLLGTNGGTQQAFAQRVGLPASVVSGHLSGQRRIQATHLAAYLKGIDDERERTSLLGAWLRDNLQTEYFWITIAEELPIFVWVTDDTGQILWCNQHWLVFTGQTFNDVLENWRIPVHPEDAETVHKLLMESVKSRKPVTQNYRVKRYDGVWRRIHARGVPRYDALGKFLGLVGFSLDVTELLIRSTLG